MRCNNLYWKCSTTSLCSVLSSEGNCGFVLNFHNFSLLSRAFWCSFRFGSFSVHKHTTSSFLPFGWIMGTRSINVFIFPKPQVSPHFDVRNLLTKWASRQKELSFSIGAQTDGKRNDLREIISFVSHSDWMLMASTIAALHKRKYLKSARAKTKTRNINQS